MPLQSGIRFFHWGHALSLCLLFAFSPLANADAITDMRAVARSGAYGLALELIQQAQPDITVDAVGWTQWEQERVQVLVGQGGWHALNARLTSLPDSVSVEFAAWATAMRARALVELKRGAEARSLLRTLLWSGGGSARDVAYWRRLVIQSYRAGGRGDDAYAAMTRYRQDFGGGGRDEALLSAQVLLGYGRPADAAQTLVGVVDAESQSLLLLARMRSGELAPRPVLRDIRERLKDKGLPPTLRQQLEAMAAEAAGHTADHAAQAIALEHLFASARRTPFDQDLFHLTPDDLWEAYLNYARQVGNREQLLMGDDAAWYAAAQAAGRMYPIKARSIYALMALQGLNVEARSQAHDALRAHVLEQEDGIELLRQLYLGAPRFADMRDVPEGVRRTLVDPVIAEGDLPLASRLLAGLDEPAVGIDRTMWRLRQARVFVLGGEHGRAVQVLEALIRDSSNLSRPEVDRLVQVMFDLQTVGEHDSAYRLFGVLLTQTGDQQMQRELLYWMADSRLAQMRYREAAALYLRSAILPGHQTMDPWAQTARYQAAQALGKAGLVQDARIFYSQLLAITEDPSRRAVLRRDLQQLGTARQ